MGSDLDAEVRDALARGDAREAARLAFASLGGELRAYMLATLRDADEAADLHGQLAEQLVRSMPRFRGESSVRTFVYGIAWNLVRQHRRSARRSRTTRELDTSDPRLAARPRTSTARFRGTTAKLRLEEARAALTREELTLLVLRIDRSMSWTEIGAVLGTGSSAAETAVLRKRFERLVKRLKRMIAPDPGG